MKKHCWNLVLVDVRKPRGARSVRISGLLIALCVTVVVIGLAGFGHLAYRGASYAFAVYSAVGQNRENNKLKTQIDNLERFVAKKTDGIVEFAAFEDSARLKYGMEAISGDVRKAGVGGFPSIEDMHYSSMKDPLIIRAEALRMQVTALNHQTELQEATFSQVSRHAQRTHNYLAKRPAIWPTQGRMTSPFGYRHHPLGGGRRMHEGIDIANSVWTPIHATADGRVRETSSGTHFGNMVKIDHGEDYMTLYAHMIRYAVTAGQPIKRGDLVGYMGSTGKSTGNHLHYEVRHRGRLVNPLHFIIPEEQIVD
ncbi:MAG: M23 family metallopeptidase [Chitinispirillales bacterium]|jgi:murein DD-endopeptidase MepM/ murein hydrolase activator NlpD|nr:M23 family metallopeptidase [Chitinispirillales bacterium]